MPSPGKQCWPILKLLNKEEKQVLQMHKHGYFQLSALLLRFLFSVLRWIPITCHPLPFMVCFIKKPLPTSQHLCIQLGENCSAHQPHVPPLRRNEAPDSHPTLSHGSHLPWGLSRAVPEAKRWGEDKKKCGPFIREHKEDFHEP